MEPITNLIDVIKKFDSEEKCRTMLEKMRWPDGVIVCPKCGQRGAYRNSDMKTYKCRAKTCKSRFSITVGTVMESTKLPLSKWFVAIYLITAHKKGISSAQLARDLKIKQHHAWHLLHRIREMLKNNAPHMLYETVEIDEVHIGGKWGNMTKKKRAKMAADGKDNKVSVMGLVERGGMGKLTVIGKRNFKEVIRENVDLNAFINTDEHLGYWGLQHEFADHAMVNHGKGEFFRDGVHTNTVEGFFSLFTRSILGIYHQISPKHLQRYCDETSFRYSYRKMTDPNRFIGSLGQMQGRLTYNKLTGKVKSK